MENPEYSSILRPVKQVLDPTRELRRVVVGSHYDSYVGHQYVTYPLRMFGRDSQLESREGLKQESCALSTTSTLSKPVRKQLPMQCQPIYIRREDVDTIPSCQHLSPLYVYTSVPMCTEVNPSLVSVKLMCASAEIGSRSQHLDDVVPWKEEQEGVSQKSRPVKSRIEE